MSRNEMIECVKNYHRITACGKCVLRGKMWSYYRAGCMCPNIERLSDEELEKAIQLINEQTGSSPENGGNNMEKPTITISLERYDELIKKEVLYDELTKDKCINMYLYQDVKEPLKEDK